MGKVNSYAAIDPADLTGGIYNARTLGEGNNAMCFATQFLAQTMPDMVSCSGVLNDLTGALSGFTKAFNTAFSALSCPEITSIDDNQFKQFPVSTVLQQR